MVAECRMYSSYKGDARVERCCSIREETSLTGSRHTQRLAIPFRQGGNIIDRTDTSYDYPLVVAVVAIIHAKVPIAVQGTIHQVIIEGLWLGDIHTMYTYL